MNIRELAEKILDMSVDAYKKDTVQEYVIQDIESEIQAAVNDIWEQAAEIAENHGNGNPVSVLHHAGEKIAEALRAQKLREMKR